MAISITLNEYISLQNINHSIPNTDSSMRSNLPPTQSLHLPTDQVAKIAILQKNADQYVLATLPSNSPILINEINATLGAKYHKTFSFLKAPYNTCLPIPL